MSLVKPQLFLDKPPKPKSELPGAIIFWLCILVLILAWSLSPN